MSAKKAKQAETTAAQEAIPVPTPRLLERYEKEILPALAKDLGRANRHSLPKLVKIVINMGVGKAASEKKHLEEALDAIKQISGQKPLVTLSRKSIANFKLREGMAIGCKVTLRGKRMYEFLDRLVAMALPRVRDFRGLDPNAFDGRGNYNLGITEQVVFPEINPDKFTGVHRIAPVVTSDIHRMGTSSGRAKCAHEPLLMRTMRSVTWL